MEPGQQVVINNCHTIIMRKATFAWLLQELLCHVGCVVLVSSEEGVEGF